jgi:alkyl hydroperoxide reductase subunit AhpF
VSGRALPARDREAIEELFADLEQDVPVLLELGPIATPVTLLAAGGREVDTGGETRTLVEEVASLSERITLEVVEHEHPGPWPQLTIGDGLLYRGMPVGYELAALVHAIVEAGRIESTLSRAAQERLGTLERDVLLEVYVTPT